MEVTTKAKRARPGITTHRCQSFKPRDVTRQHRVPTYFPDHGLIVETDGWDFHKDRAAFEDDRERDAHQLAHGVSTVRITRERLDTTPDREAVRLQEIMQARSAHRRPS
jgi:very-short-patch-repair endonuclease